MMTQYALTPDLQELPPLSLTGDTLVLLALFAQMERTHSLKHATGARAAATAKGQRIGRPSAIAADKLAYRFQPTLTWRKGQGSRLGTGRPARNPTWSIATDLFGVPICARSYSSFSAAEAEDPTAERSPPGDR